MNKIQEQDIREFAEQFALSDQLAHSVFLITGATGLIGSTLVHCLLALDRDIKVIAPVRNGEKAELMFSKTELDDIKIIECDIIKFDYNQLPHVDYIVHCAAPTASKYFVEHPVETFYIIVDGTKVLLEYAKDNPIKGFVYLSSLEVYGEIHDDSQPVTEEVQGYLNPLNIRSSYPMAKRAAETLCCLYAAQYGVPVKIARLTQTTGAGISTDDNRVIVQFVRLASKGENIVLNTKGESARPYCYTIDAVSAIISILLNGITGEAYNIANAESYINVLDLAKKIKKNVDPNIGVFIKESGHKEYAPITKLRLSTQKIESLGWRPKYSINDIINNLLNYLLSL